MILHPNKTEFILPNIKNGISFTTGQKVQLVCPGQSNHLAVTSNIKEVTATCVANKTFTVSNNIGNKQFKELKCKNYPDPTAKRTGKKCSSNYTEIEIGFETKAGFIPLMLNCFDPVKKDTLYSKYNLSSKIKSQQFSVPRPNGFDEGDFYNDLYPKPSTIYERRSQRTGFERILGSAELAAKYISLKTDFFLSRGHFTAKADFVYGSQQRATFFYVNVAPQWHTMNGNNWNELEMSVRNFAGKRNLDLTVYTGVHGSARLPDVNNHLQELSLYVNGNKRALTVPAIFWKIVHNPVAKTGTVFVGHNNPYDKNVTAICKDLGSKINWVSWDAKNITAGYSYSCDYADFKRTVTYLPDLAINGILV